MKKKINKPSKVEKKKLYKILQIHSNPLLTTKINLLFEMD
jgi:hypothetical protein